MEMNENTFQWHLRVTLTQFDFFNQKLEEKCVGDVHPHGEPEMAKKIVTFLWYLQRAVWQIQVSHGAANKVIVEVLQPFSSHPHSSLGQPMQRSSMWHWLHRWTTHWWLPHYGPEANCLGRRLSQQKVLLFNTTARHSWWDEVHGHFHWVSRGLHFKNVENFAIPRELEAVHESVQAPGRHRLCTYPIPTPSSSPLSKTMDDQQLNALISRGRLVVQQAFGRLKCQWRQLRDFRTAMWTLWWRSLWHHVLYTTSILLLLCCLFSKWYTVWEVQ